MWAEELQRSELSRDVQKAEQLLRLHNESVQHMQNTTFQVLQRGQELAQVGGATLSRSVGEPRAS
jgi:triple functional domain protein